MKSKEYFIPLFSIYILLSFNISCLPQNNTIKDKNTIIEIPQELLTYINKKLPYHHIPNLNDYIKEWSVFYNYDTLQIPYFVKGDFNGDKQEDYALLLQDTLEQFGFYIFNCIHNQDFILHCIFAQANGIKNIEKINVGLYFHPKGDKLFGVDGKIKLDNDAIEINYFETSSQLYYWENGEYKEFWLSD